MEYTLEHYRLDEDGKFFLMQMSNEISNTYYLIEIPRANPTECGAIHTIMADDVKTAKERATNMMLDLLVAEKLSSDVK